MKIIKPSFEIWPRDEQRGGLSIIERAGRVCYKSEPGQTPESAENFVRGLIRRHHNSVLEHGDMIFEISDDHIYCNLVETLQRIRDTGEQPPMLETTRIGRRCVVSGNIRAWRELFAMGSIAGRYFIGFFDPVYVRGWGFEDEDLVGIPDNRIRQIFYRDLREPGEKRAHLRQTVRFTCDRGVSHEFVRHRVMSFAQESTRYCNYSLDRFGREITVIEPCYLSEHTESYDLWKRQCMSAETAYFTELNQSRGAAPQSAGSSRDSFAKGETDEPPVRRLSAQEARAVLPTSTKTELVVTGNLRGWDHFFDLRARQLTGPAHPQAAELALPLMGEMYALFPDVIDGDRCHEGLPAPEGT